MGKIWKRLEGTYNGWNGARPCNLGSVFCNNNCALLAVGAREPYASFDSWALY